MTHLVPATASVPPRTRPSHPGVPGSAAAVLIALLVVIPRLVLARVRSVDDRERGDVPGWVMITLMSAVLVAALLAIAAPALQGLFEQAIQQVQPRR